MAEEPKKAKKPRIRKTPETVRDMATKKASRTKKPKGRLKGKIHRPLSVLHRIGQKEYHPVPVPKNKAGRLLGKRVNLIPKFLRESFADLKLVNWPSRKMAARLTFAVIVFATVFAAFVQVLDLIFNKLVKVILLK
jgi:preprotein translocase SecE subunit